jgi:hypothetical protein
MVLFKAYGFGEVQVSSGRWPEFIPAQRLRPGYDEREMGFLVDIPTALPWAGMNDAVGVTANAEYFVYQRPPEQFGPGPGTDHFTINCSIWGMRFFYAWATSF